jgi:hypothetical protein
MKRRHTIWTPLFVGSALLTAFGTGSCSSSKSNPVGLAQGCTLNSDCNDPLVCIFSLCHQACTTTRDCPAPEICVAAGSDKVCTLPSESCTDGGSCPVGLLCGSDGQCHDPCTTSADCTVSGQECVSRTCVDASDGGVAEGGGAGEGGGSGEGGGLDATSESSSDAPYVPSDAGGALGFVASNLPPGDVPTSAFADAGDGGAPSVTVTTSCSNCLPITPVTISQNDGSPADLYVLSSLTVTTTATLGLTGPNPVIIAVLGSANIFGTLSVSANVTTAGAGGFSPGPNLGPGGGQTGTGMYAESGGGGAGYCGGGGTAWATGGSNAPGGPTYGNATITPLLGGSAGGSEAEAATGGGGGGAIQIVAGASITVGPEGVITAGGGGGEGDNQGGGGSGGAILLEAPSVTITGNLAANGGGGGPGGANATGNATAASGGLDGAGHLVGGAGSAGKTLPGGAGLTNTDGSLAGGGGGAGRIRINTASGGATITGIVSPDPTTSCVSQGKIGG